jgi:large subunit ribosomal protein L15
MLKLNNIGSPQGVSRDRKRLGRGIGSGRGKTAGKGHKGQKARSGGGIPAYFEGGQMPLNRRLPKRGFTNIFKKVYQIVNLEDLDRFEAGSTVDPVAMAASGLIKRADQPVKLLGRGQVEKALKIEVARASKAAIAAVEAVGGSVTCQG